jgi:hypothetical protein
VTIHFFVRTFGVTQLNRNKLKLDMLEFYRCCYSITLVSDRRERNVGRAVGHSAYGDRRPYVNTPLFVRDVTFLLNFLRSRKEECMSKDRFADSIDELQIGNVHPKFSPRGRQDRQNGHRASAALGMQ